MKSLIIFLYLISTSLSYSIEKPNIKNIVINPVPKSYKNITFKDSKNKDFMLLCGFEKFDSLFVRIDILERLFMQIINSDSKETKQIKMIPEMLNLLGCSKDNFKKLLKKMGYKIFDKENETFFKYSPMKNFKKDSIKKISSENPFKILKNLNLG